MQQSHVSDCHIDPLGYAFGPQVACGCKGGKNSANGEVKGYPSPGKAFDAYKRACEAGDYLGEFHCLTPESQDRMVCDAFVGCVELAERNPKASKS